MQRGKINGLLMKWFVKLLGNKDDLEDLSKVCNSPELIIRKEEDYFILESKDFEKLENHTDVYHKACEIVVLINGATTIALRNKEPLRIENVIKVDDEGRKNFYSFSSVNITLPRIRCNLTIKSQNGKNVEFNEAAPVPYWYQVAQKEKKVAEVLSLLAENDLYWEKLYILYEEVLGDVKSAIDKKGWVTKKDIKRFTQTAQQYRHGESGLKSWKPPKHPMTFEEGKSFVLHIIEIWLKYKCTK